MMLLGRVAGSMMTVRFSALPGRSFARITFSPDNALSRNELLALSACDLPMLFNNPIEKGGFILATRGHSTSLVYWATDAPNLLTLVRKVVEDLFRAHSALTQVQVEVNPNPYP